MQIGITYQISIEQLKYLVSRRERFEDRSTFCNKYLGFTIIAPGNFTQMVPELKSAEVPTCVVVIYNRAMAGKNRNLLYLRAI